MGLRRSCHLQQAREDLHLGRPCRRFRFRRLRFRRRRRRNRSRNASLVARCPVSSERRVGWDESHSQLIRAEEGQGELCPCCSIYVPHTISSHASRDWARKECRATRLPFSAIRAILFYFAIVGDQLSLIPQPTSWLAETPDGEYICMRINWCVTLYPHRCMRPWYF